MNALPFESLTRARFSERLHTHFRVTVGAPEPVELELVEVTSGGTVAKGGAELAEYESFSLLFYGAQTRPLQQGMYPFEHPQLGRFDLFIVPIAAEKGLVHYQAVFNRLVKPG